MTTVLDSLREALDGLGAIDAPSLPLDEQAEVVVELRQLITGLEAEYARFVHHAEQTKLWATRGATSMAAWLAGQTGTSVGRAKAELRLADTLAAVPSLAAAVREGHVSLDNAHLLGSVAAHEAFADSAADLVGFAASASPSEVRRELDTWLALVDPDGEAVRERRGRERRALSFHSTIDGMIELRGLFTVEDGRVVRNAVEHLAGAAWNDHTARTHSQRAADALVELAAAYAKGAVTGGRERPRLLVTATYETIFERASTRGRLSTGETISADAVRRLSCDADLHRVITSGRSTTLDLGTATRFATTAQYLALVERDGGCRHPNCDRPPEWTQIHHIIPAADRGSTDISNLILACAAHHHYVHRPDVHLLGDAHDLRVQLPTGLIVDAPPRGRSPAAAPAASSLARSADDELHRAEQLELVS